MFCLLLRMNKYVDALVNSGKVLEINACYKIRNQAMIQKAKDTGVKFAFRINNAANNPGKPEYCIEIKKAI